MTFEKFFGHDIDYSKAATMFTIHHLIYFLSALLTISFVIYNAERIKAWCNEKRLRYILIGTLVFFEITYHIHNWTYPRLSLPLHICSFAVILNIILLYTKSEKIFTYAFFFGTLGGIMALTFPNSLGYTYYNFRYYHFLILHNMIIFVPLYFYKGYGFRVTYSDLLMVYKHTFMLAVVIYLINAIFLRFGYDANYWFISYVPSNVESFFKVYQLYVITHLSAVFLSMNILYYLTHVFPQDMQIKAAK